MSPSGRTPLVWRTYLPLKEEKKRGWRKKVDGDDGWKLHPKLNEWLTDEIFVWPIAQNSGRCNHEYELSPGFLGCYPLCLSRHRPGHRQTIWRYIFSLNLNPKLAIAFLCSVSAYGMVTSTTQRALTPYLFKVP